METVVLATRVPQKTIDEIDKAVELGIYISQSQLVKTAVDRELKRIEKEEVAA
jgi:Arc/MetJ-type ribon-helix-helix transcriptional regulator